MRQTSFVTATVLTLLAMVAGQPSAKRIAGHYSFGTACGDTVSVRAVQRYAIPTGATAASFTETLTMTVLPGRRYLVEMLRPASGPSGNYARISVGGIEYFGTADLGAPGVMVSRTINPIASGTMQVTLSGSAGFGVDVRITQVAEPTYPVLTTSFQRGSGAPKWQSKPFAFDNGAPATPHLLVLTNGNPDGTARTQDTEVMLNGTQVVFPGELTTGMAQLTRSVLLSNVNQLDVKIVSALGTKVGIKIRATDTTAPGIEVAQPAEAMVTEQAKVLTTGSVIEGETGAGVAIDGVAKAMVGLTFSDSLSLPFDGIWRFNYEATNGACLTATTTRSVIRDTQAPVLTVNLPNGTTTETNSPSITVTGTWSDTSRTVVTIDGEPVPNPDSSGAFSVPVALDPGTNGIHFRARDAVGHEVSFKRYVYRVPNETLPIIGASGSAIGATPLSQTELTPFSSAIAFIHSGSSPVQINMAPDTLIAGREAVIHGRVLARDYNPLPNVTVRVLGRPGYGETRTRADGAFDLVVNGGTALTLRYLKDDFLEAQRQVIPRVQDYTTVEDVAMVGRSSRSFAVNTASLPFPPPVVTRFENDLNGDRKTTLMFSPGTICTVTPPAGPSVQYTQFHVRAKEFTVGSNGDEAMPAPLPASTAYAFCAELTVDEAPTSNGGPEPKVTFSKPVAIYTKNILGLDVGNVVPLGFYEKSLGLWMPSDNGRVVRVEAWDGDLAVLDTDDTPGADAQARYDELGIDDVERRQVKLGFAVGDTLLRVRVSHFSTPDANPTLASIARALTDAPQDLFYFLQSIIDKFQTQSCGCVIENENRVLGQSLAVTGTPFTLNYRSSRQPGDLAMRTVTVPLTGTVAPQNLKAIQVIVEVAGRRFSYRETRPSMLTLPNRTWLFDQWDGTDVYGRPVVGSTTATIRLGYEIEASYARMFTDRARYGDGAGAGNGKARVAMGDRAVGRTIWQTQAVSIGAPSMASAGLGGWTLSPHHFYDTNGQGTLYMGDGSYWTGAQVVPSRSRVAGNGNLPAASGLSLPQDGDIVSDGGGGPVAPYDMAFGPNGDLYFTDKAAHRVARVTPAGKYFVVAGGAGGPYQTDGVDARNTTLDAPGAVDVGPDGSVYFTHTGNDGSRVFRVTPGDNKLQLVAGTPANPFSEGMLAKDAPLVGVSGVAVSKDGIVYIGTEKRIYRVGTDGRITTCAGAGQVGALTQVDGELGRADSIYVSNPGDMVVDDNGNLQVLMGAARIYTVSTDNRLYSRALKTADGQSIVSASAIARGPRGEIYAAQNAGSRMSVFRVESSGGLTLMVGGLQPRFLFREQDHQPARATVFSNISSIAADAAGTIFVAELPVVQLQNGSGISCYRAEPPAAIAGEITIPSADGHQIFSFNANGKHLRTTDAWSGVTLYAFGYDALTGELNAITDADGLVTTITRAPGEIVIHAPAPFGQQTVIHLEASGKYVASVSNPKQEQYQMGYLPGGLMETFADPSGKTWIYTYKASDGRLESERGPQAPDNKKLLLTVSESGTERAVTLKSPEGRSTSYFIRRSLDGDRKHSTTTPDGAVDSVTSGMSAETVGAQFEKRTTATGSITTATSTRHPRYGWIAPVDTSELVALTPAGPNQVITRAWRADNGIIQESMAINGFRYLSSYDSVGRVLTESTPAGRRRISTFDAAGRLTSVAFGASIDAVSIDYFPSADARKGRVRSVTQGSRVWSYDYDSKGRLATVTNPMPVPFQRTTSFGYDLADRVSSVSLPGNHTVGYTYLPNGALETLTPPGRPAHSYSYSNLDDLSGYTPPAVAGAPSPATGFLHNWDRQLTTVQRPGGGSVVLDYDATKGQLNSITQPGRAAVSFQYFPAPGSPTQPAGLLHTVTSPDIVTCTYGYNGPLLASVTWSGNISGAVSRTFNNRFMDSTETVTVGAANSVVTNVYGDADGLLTSVQPVGMPELTIHHRLVDGQVDSTQVGGVIESRDYNSYGELANLRYRIGSTVLLQQSITRDALGRATDITETWSGPSGPESRTTHYDHDPDTGWLTKVSVNSAQVRRYVYDGGGVGNGNRTAEYGPLDVLLASATHDEQDRLKTYGDATYTWTAAGELLQRERPSERFSTTYDALGNLLSAGITPLTNGVPQGLNIGTSISYRVDGQNRRVQRLVNGVAERGWLYRDGLSPVAELDGSGALLNRYVYGTSSHTPDLVVRGGVVYRVIADHLGSIRMIVDATSGAVVQRLDYDAWGALTVDTAPAWQSLGYVSGIQDRETGLVRFGARDYEAGVGRWTAKDPAGVQSGSNFYRYAANTPTVRTDHSGLASSGLHRGTVVNLTGQCLLVSGSNPNGSGQLQFWIPPWTLSPHTPVANDDIDAIYINGKVIKITGAMGSLVAIDVNQDGTIRPVWWAMATMWPNQALTEEEWARINGGVTPPASGPESVTRPRRGR